MAALPYFPFFAQDWLSDPDVTAMDLDVQGAYVRLLANMWVAGHGRCDLPDDDERLAKILGIKLREWRKIRPKLSEVLRCEDGRISNDKLTELFAHAEDVSRTNASNGSKGGRPKKANGKRTESERKPDGLRMESERQTDRKATQESESESEREGSPPSPPAGGSVIGTDVGVPEPDGEIEALRQFDAEAVNFGAEYSDEQWQALRSYWAQTGRRYGTRPLKAYMVRDWLGRVRSARIRPEHIMRAIEIQRTQHPDKWPPYVIGIADGLARDETAGDVGSGGTKPSAASRDNSAMERWLKEKGDLLGAPVGGDTPNA